MRENTSIPYSRIPNFGEAPSKQCLQAKLQCLVITKSIRPGLISVNGDKFFLSL